MEVQRPDGSNPASIRRSYVGKALILLKILEKPMIITDFDPFLSKIGRNCRYIEMHCRYIEISNPKFT